MPETPVVKRPLTLRWGVPFAGKMTFTPGGVAMDLTGLKVTANLHSGTPESPGAVVQTISTDNGRITIATPNTGIATFALTGAIIATFATGDYIMPVFILNNTNTVIAGGHPFIRYVQVLKSGVSP